MASVITATTSSGITQSADNSGVLQLASGVGNNVTIPAVTGTAMVSGNMPAFSAYQSSAQTLSSAVVTKIQLQTEEYDTANCFDNATNYRFTPNVSGYYQFNASLQVGAAATGCYVSLYKNGAEIKRGNNFAQNSSFGSCISATIYLNGSTDYVEFYGYFSSGQVVASGASQTYFQGFLARTA